MVVGEFYGLYGVDKIGGDGCTAICVGGGLVYIVCPPMHVHVLGRHVHCFKHSMIVMS